MFFEAVAERAGGKSKQLRRLGLPVARHAKSLEDQFFLVALDDLFERLEGHFEEARAYFESRVEPELLYKENFVDRAIVDVLICGSRSVRARIW